MRIRCGEFCTGKRSFAIHGDTLERGKFKNYRSDCHRRVRARMRNSNLCVSRWTLCDLDGGKGTGRGCCCPAIYRDSKERIFEKNKNTNTNRRDVLSVVHLLQQPQQNPIQDVPFNVVRAIKMYLFLYRMQTAYTIYSNLQRNVISDELIRPNDLTYPHGVWTNRWRLYLILWQENGSWSSQLRCH